jgi:DNA-binding response OmpR family regulator
MSSRLSESEIDMYRRIGADEILKKPLDSDQVVALVEKAIAA